MQRPGFLRARTLPLCQSRDTEIRDLDRFLQGLAGRRVHFDDHIVAVELVSELLETQECYGNATVGGHDRHGGLFAAKVNRDFNTCRPRFAASMRPASEDRRPAGESMLGGLNSPADFVPTVPQVPNPHGLIVTAGGNLPTIRSICQGGHGASMPVKTRKFFARTCCPQFDSAVETS
jgi:hypothetical protein